MGKNVLVVDVGTQSLRASVIDEKGDILGFSKQRYQIPFLSPEEGFAEQDADFYLDRLCDATSALKSEHPGLLETVVALVVVTFRDSIVILDENKEPIRPAILWLDQRITDMPKMDYLKWYEKVIFSVIGMKDTAKYNAERTHSYWLKKYERENWEKMRYYVPVQAYFNYKMTGRLALSSADCCGHFPINFKKGKWFGKLHPKTDVFSIPKEALPELIKQGEIIGFISEEFSKRSSIPVKIPVIASGSDKSCETLGNGCLDEKAASISLGTACTIDVVSEKYSEPETFLPSYRAPYYGAYNLEVQIYRGLWMVKWYIDNFGGREIEEDAKNANLTPEEYMNMKIKDVPIGSDGLILQPYWGPGLKRPNARGAMVGFTGEHTKYHIFRAIYEGLAYALREGLDSIVKKTKKLPDEIIISGGGANSDVFCQIIADIFNIKCKRMVDVESSSLGGAISGFLALGVYKNPKEAVSKMVGDYDVFTPNEKNARIYDKLYKETYLKLYPKLKKIYKSQKYSTLEAKGKIN